MGGREGPDAWGGWDANYWSGGFTEAYIAELEAGREPLTLAGAREQYIARLRTLDAGAIKAELEALADELGFAT